MPNSMERQDFKRLGLSTVKQIYNSFNSKVYQAIKDDDQSSVIIKVYNSNSFSPLLLAQLKNEFRIIQTLNHPNIIKVYQLVESIEGLSLIIEDFEGLAPH